MSVHKKDLENFYKTLKAGSLEKWKKLDPNKISDVCGSVETDPKFRTMDGLGIRMLAKLAHHCQDANEFIQIIESNEMPAVKLDQKEMELLKGGAGGGRSKVANTGKDGGNGGGIIIIFAKAIELASSALLSANGDVGVNAVASAGGGGGGAGGSILIKTQQAILGTNKMTVSGGAGGAQAASGGGGDGSIGRMHVDYSSYFSGSATPSIDTTQSHELGMDGVLFGSQY
jgi:hypothetical protein